MRKLRLVLVMALVAGSALAACSWPGRSAADADTQLPFAVKYWTASKSRSQYMQQMALAWNRLYPQRALNLQVSVFEDDRIDSMTWTSLHSGILLPGLEAPDLVDVDFQYFPKYANQRYCLLNPLNEIVTRYLQEQGNSGVLYAYTYREMCFGIPFGADDMILVYQNDILTAAGIDMQTVETWDDFIQAGVRLREAGDARMIGMDMDDYLVFLMVLQQLCQQSGETAPNEALYTQTLTMLRSLYESGVAVLMPGGRIHSKLFLESFLAGDIACVLMRRADYLEMLPKLSDIAQSLGTMTPPGFGGSQPARVPGDATAITTACTQMRLLMDFLTFARLDPQAQTEMAEWFGYTLTEQETLRGDECLLNADDVLAYLETYEMDLAALIYTP